MNTIDSSNTSSSTYDYNHIYKKAKHIRTQYAKKLLVVQKELEREILSRTTPLFNIPEINELSYGIESISDLEDNEVYINDWTTYQLEIINDNDINNLNSFDYEPEKYGLMIRTLKSRIEELQFIGKVFVSILQDFGIANIISVFFENSDLKYYINVTRKSVRVINKKYLY